MEAFRLIANYSGRGALRSVCVDPIEYDQNDRLKVVQNWGQPYEGKAPEVDVSETLVLEAEHYNRGGEHYGYHKNPSEGDIQVGTDNGITYLKSMKSGEWVRYSINVKQTGSYAITCRMCQQCSGGKFRIAINGVYKTNEIKLNSSGSTWNEAFIYPVELQKGEQYIDLRIQGGELDIDCIKLGEGCSQVPDIIQAEDFEEVK